MNINEVMDQIDAFYAAGRGPEAEKLMCSAIQEAAAAGEEENMLQLLNELLGYYRETSQVENSFAIAEQVITLAQRMGLMDTIHYATCLLNVANAYRAGDRLEDSLACYEKVRQIYDRTMKEDNMLVASLENNLSLLYQEMGEFARAKECLQRALSIVTGKNAEFEIAVTYANLSGTCMQLQETEEAYRYGKLAIEKFEEMGVRDAHYGAALSAMGSYCFAGKEFAQARAYFAEAQTIMEQNLGRNEYYYRLQENVEQCDRALAGETDRAASDCAETDRGAADRKASEDGPVAVCQLQREQKGLELCRAYYETYGKPMIEERFPDYVDKIAVGLVGEGSDCFGYDDAISRDHDWGPDFCMWVTGETYAQIGEALQKAYEELPHEFQSYVRTVSPQGLGRRGVQIIEDFYGRILGDSVDPIDWTHVPDYALAAAVNGAVFRDTEGVFTGIRNGILQGYPEDILYKKLAESAARFSQTGQYNYARCLQRGDVVTAQILLGDCMREAMKLKHYIEGAYPPHDKWLRRSLEELPGGQQLSALLEELAGSGSMGSGAEQGTGWSAEEGAAGKREKDIHFGMGKTGVVIEKIASFLAADLYAHHFISDSEAYLDAHTEELLVKASLVGLTQDQLVDKIARLEFAAFDKVQNVGGRAGCQNDWPTFYVMRKSQYLTWNKTMLLQYYYDFQSELQKGHNLITEKYGRMMESTAPDEYERIKEHFPEISPEKQAIIEQIVAMQVSWMEEFAAEYPRMADNARSVRTAEDNLYNTSYETYLRGEISTYSDKMLELYGRYVVEYAAGQKNLAREIMSHSARMYGYHDLDAAEAAL